MSEKSHMCNVCKKDADYEMNISRPTLANRLICEACLCTSFSRRHAILPGMLTRLKNNQKIEAIIHKQMMLWLEEQWFILWDNKDEIAKKWFNDLTGPDFYGASDRHYHNLKHIMCGLSAIEDWTEACKEFKKAKIIKKAFWFHDAVYNTQIIDNSNEAASAQLWLNSGLDEKDKDVVADLILATNHFAERWNSCLIKDVMLDADLTVFGLHERIYETYAQNIRKEYAWASDEQYKSGRTKILERFYKQALAEELYKTGYFSYKYNEKAIKNIENEIKMLTLS